jgi:hypothetical protein
MFIEGLLFLGYLLVELVGYVHVRYRDLVWIARGRPIQREDLTIANVSTNIAVMSLMILALVGVRPTAGGFPVTKRLPIPCFIQMPCEGTFAISQPIVNDDALFIMPSSDMATREHCGVLLQCLVLPVRGSHARARQIQVSRCL